MDEKEKEQEMCVPAESSGTSPTFKWCCLYKKRKEVGSTLWRSLGDTSSFALRIHKTTNNSLNVFHKLISTVMPQTVVYLLKKKRSPG